MKLQLARKNQRVRRRADRVPTHLPRWGDEAFSMMEILGVIAIGLILAGAAVVAVPRFLDRGRDASATASLTTAVTEAREIYTRVVGEGRQNFTGRSLVAGATAATLTTTAVTELNDAETNLCYYSLITGGACGAATFVPATAGTDALEGAGKIKTAGLGQAGADEIRKMGTTAIWVHVSEGENWDTGGDEVRAGNLIRMGTSSDSGATYCAMLVADSTVAGAAGTGFMARAEDTSNSATVDAIVAGGTVSGWAHCGLQQDQTVRDAFALGVVGVAEGAVTPGLAAPQ